MEKTNMDTAWSIWAALTGGPWRGALEPVNAGRYRKPHKSEN